MEKLNWIERTEDGNFRLTDFGRELELEGSGLVANRSEAWFEEKLDVGEIKALEALLRKLDAWRAKSGRRKWPTGHPVGHSLSIVIR